jgi:hypothetical protein
VSEPALEEPALELHELSFVSEGDEVMVGRPDTGSYAVFPADGAELVRRIAGGMSLSQASAWYEQSFGEPVDIGDFAATLAELGFVREPGAAPAPAKRTGLRWLARAVFSPAAWACYACLTGLWLAAAAHTSALFPHPGQVFFTGSLVVVQIVITFGQMPLLFLHEGMHILAGRRLGLPSRLGVSNRFTYIVFETQLNGLMSVPRKARYLPFVAGLVGDLAVFCSLGLIAEVTRQGNGSFSLAGRVCLALAFTVALRMLWQFQLYLRTDLYYVFATALNCYDLHDASIALLRNRIWRALGRPDGIVDERQWTQHDRKVGALYGPFIAAGLFAMVFITVFGTIPVIRLYVVQIARELVAGPAAPHFWDSAISLAFNAAQIAALIAVWQRKRRVQAGRRPRLLSEQENPS